MSNRDLYNIINQHMRPKITSPLANDMFSLINNIDQTVGMFDMLLNSEPHIEIHVIEMNDGFRNNFHNQTEKGLRERNDQVSGPIIEILDDSSSHKEVLQKVTSETCLPKSYNKWIVRKTSKSTVGMLNDLELDVALQNAFNVI